MGARALRVVTTAALAAVALAGCSGGESRAPETTPEGAVVLAENAPHDVSGGWVVATDVEEDAATLRVTEGSDASTPTPVEVGGSVTVAGSTWRVEAIWSEGDSGQPGGQGGRVMIVPAP